MLRVPDQNGISQACRIVEIYHSGPEPSIYTEQLPSLVTFHADNPSLYYRSIVRRGVELGDEFSKVFAGAALQVLQDRHQHIQHWLAAQLQLETSS